MYATQIYYNAFGCFSKGPALLNTEVFPYGYTTTVWKKSRHKCFYFSYYMAGNFLDSPRRKYSF